MTNYNIKKLQERCGVVADGEFGPQTLKAAAKLFKLSNTEAAHFFAQLAHETGDFKHAIENLNYSTKGLRTTFSKYFKSDVQANLYARNPQLIANKVYANRMGNGPEESGDGWRYRGRGAIQLTGRHNYEEFAKHLKVASNDHKGGDAILANPDIVATDYYFDSAKFFFDKNNLWALCFMVNEPLIKEVTKKINGGFHGLNDRANKTYKFYKWLTES